MQNCASHPFQKLRNFQKKPRSFNHKKITLLILYRPSMESKFQCPNCFRVFTRKQSLNYHMSSQTACKFACISENNQIKIFLKENQSFHPPPPPHSTPPPPVNLRIIPVKITKNSLKIPDFSKKNLKRKIVVLIVVKLSQDQIIWLVILN